MARNRQATPAQTAFVLLMFAVALIGPFLILGYWLLREAANRSNGGAAAIRESAGAGDQSRLHEEMAALFELGDEAGFERRSDGMFDARSSEARRLNRAIADLHEEVSILQEESDFLSAEQAKLDSSRLAAATLVLTFGFLYFSKPEMGWFMQSLAASALALMLGFGRYWLAGSSRAA